VPVSGTTRIAAQSTARSLHRLAESLEHLAETASESGNEHRELERIAELLEEAAESLGGGIREGAVSQDRLRRVADIFVEVGEALRPKG
jgi:heptaprenylglyceryl phosphate synthase